MLLKGIHILSVVLAAVFCLILEFPLWLCLPVFAGCWLGLLILAFLILWLFSIAVDLDKPQEEDSKLYRAVMHLYIEALIPLVGMKVETAGLEKTPKEGRYLLVCNHQNESDPGILLHYFKSGNLAFISKKEARSMFVVGGFMHKILCQLVNRENDREALKTILTCIRLIKEDKVSVGVFPEGGIIQMGKLSHFRSGVLKIAQKTKVPIVVCTLKGTTDLFHNMKRLRPTHVRLHLVDIISAEEAAAANTVELGEKIYQMMLSDLGPEYDPGNI